jgi:DNA (cytosine-5)-methyltransferase 1
VFENVKGLTLGKHQRFVHELIAAFDDAGYAIRLPWRVLNASSFAVPQDRERLILLGAKKQLPLPSYPSAISRAAGTSPNLTGLEVGPSCQDALEDLPDADEYTALLAADSVRVRKSKRGSEYATRLREPEGDPSFFGYKRDWDQGVLTSSMRTDHSEISRRRFAETSPGEVEPISRFFRLPPDGVSNTLRAGTDSARGAFTSPRPIHYRHNRCVTVREMARLHGFPDWFRFHTTKWHGARQIGNAVAPPMARHIAREVLRAMGVRPRKPTRIVALGEQRLLMLGMSEAAAYWGVDVPIGRRDRKSGAKKRKQAEIEAERIAGRGRVIHAQGVKERKGGAVSGTHREDLL